MTPGAAWVPAGEACAAGMLVASALLLATGRAGPSRAGSLRPTSLASRVRTTAGRAAAAGARRLARPHRTGSSTAHDVQVVITQVAGLVRSGMPPDRAWAGVGVRALPDGTPATEDLLRLAHSPSQAQSVVAACRLAHQVGAPIAPVLDSIVSTLVAAAEASAARDTALASPRSTARLLLWLPAVGAGLSTVLGVGPLHLLLGGGPAVVAPVAGVLLLVVGRWWTRRLVRAAVAVPQAG